MAQAVGMTNHQLVVSAYALKLQICNGRVSTPGFYATDITLLNVPKTFGEHFSTAQVQPEKVQPDDPPSD